MEARRSITLRLQWWPLEILCSLLSQRPHGTPTAPLALEKRHLLRPTAALGRKRTKEKQKRTKERKGLEWGDEQAYQNVWVESKALHYLQYTNL